MYRHSTSRWTAALLLTVLAALVAACTSVSSPNSGGMMGNGNGGGGGPGTAMAGAAPGYLYAPLSCAAPNSLPGVVVNVILGDMGTNRMMGGVAPMGSVMMLLAAPATVPAGQITLVGENMGWRTHELVVLPLAAGTSAGRRIPGADGKVPETGSLGEASASCTAGAGDGITAGKVGWVSLTLPAGHYELLCNLPNHYADGMHQELVVT